MKSLSRLALTVLVALAITMILVPTQPADAQTSRPGSDKMPDSWFFPQRSAKLKAMEGKPAPALAIRSWRDKSVTLDSLKGNIVVVDFWATWCGPCVKALPKNAQLDAKYRDKGVTFVGVHDSRRGHEKMEQVAKKNGIKYPLGIDAGKSVRDWNIAFWPTYFILDRKGIVRGAALTPNNVEKAIRALLEEQPGKTTSTASAPSAPTGIQKQWLEGNAQQRARLAGLENNASPPISSDEWINASPMSLADLEGKVVLVDFWATWCGPCLRAIPHTNELAEKYADDGLVIIGVCHQRGVEKMAKVASDRGIQYPICGDHTGAMVKSFAVNGYPDYYLIDRSGKVRIADLANVHVESAIKMLLAESHE